jgi:hypothetical protein
MTIIEYGTPQTGLWCQVCRAYTAVRAVLYAIGDDGAYPVASATGCELNDGEGPVLRYGEQRH